MFLTSCVSWYWCVYNTPSTLKQSMFWIGWFFVSVTVADFQTPGTSLHARCSNSDTSSSAATQLASIASLLLRFSLQPSSIPNYQCAWRHLISTFQLPFGEMPISRSALALFIAYSFRSRYAPSTGMTVASRLWVTAITFRAFQIPPKCFMCCKCFTALTKLAFTQIVVFLLHCQFRLTDFHGTSLGRLCPSRQYVPWPSWLFTHWWKLFSLIRRLNLSILNSIFNVFISN